MASRGGPFGPVKLDDWDAHEGAALDAGYPSEFGFTHIGLFLAWLIRHDMFDDSMVDARHVEKVRAGHWSGSELRDDIDGSLVDDMLTAEGAAFGRARYEDYLNAYGELFSERPDYSNPDDAETYALVAPVIDRLYTEWVATGRPPPEPKPDDSDDDLAHVSIASLRGTVVVPAGFETDEDLLASFREMGLEVVNAADSPLPHEDPELEALMPAVIDGVAIEMRSVTAKDYRSALLDRSLKRLGVERKAVMVASCVEGIGDDILSAQFLRIPGLDAGRLADEFVFNRGAIVKGWTFALISIADRTIAWIQGRSEGRPRAGGTWTRDGLVISFLGPPDLLRRLIPQMRDTDDWH
jgi:hypothetical protein